MKFNIIKGRSGSGKTESLLKHIDENIDNLVITTEPSVYYIEKILADKNIPVQVISYDTIARFVLKELNVLIGTEINKESQIIMIGKIIQDEKINHQLQTFNKINYENSSLNKIYNFIVECREQNISVEDLQNVYDSSNNTLRTKLHDILIILSEFNKQLEEKKLVTKEDLVNLAIEALDNCDTFTFKNIMVDSVDSYPASFKNITKKLIEKTETFTMAFKTTSIKKYDYYICKEAMDAADEIEEFVLSTSYIRYEKEELHRDKTENNGIKDIERELFDKDIAEISTSDNVALHEASTMYKEIDYVTSQIEEMINDKKVKPEDIIITSSAIDRYINIIANSLNKHNINYFYYKNNQLSKSYIYSFIATSLKIVESDYTVDNLLAICQFDYLNVTREEFAVIDSFFLRFGHSLTVAMQNGEKYDNANYIQVKNILDRVKTNIEVLREEMSGTKKVNEFITAIMNYLDSFDIKTKMQSEYATLYSNKEIADANKIKSVWNGLIKIFNQIYDIFTDEEVSLGDFIEILNKMADDSLLSTTQQYFGQVNIIDMKQAQNKKSKIIFVVGCNENYFPESLPNQIIVDNERRSINMILDSHLKLSKDIDTEKKAAISSTLAMPSEKLFISWSLNDLDSKPLKYASILTNVVKKFENNIAKEKDFYDNDREEAFLGFLNELAVYKNTGFDNGTLSSKYMDFNKDPLYSERLYKALMSASIDKKQINVENPALAYREKDFFSVTRLESFNKCPFKHYIEHALKPERLKIFDETAADKGNYFHEVMKIFFNTLLKDKVDIDDLKQPEFEKIIDPIIDDIAKNHNDNIFDSANKFIFESYKVKERIKVSAWSAVLQLQQGSFSPARNEYSVGKEVPLDITLNNGKVVHLVGVIDRIDIEEINGEKYARIIDYKSGNIQFSEDLLKAGVQLQLPLYSKAASEDFKFAGMYYFHIANPILDADDKNDNIEKRFQLSGPTINDIPVIFANDRDLSDPSTSSKVISVDVTTKGEISKKSKVIESAKLDEMMQTSEDITKATISKIVDGETKAYPFKYKDMDSCKYCQYSSICHIDTTVKDSTRRYNP